ncbi:MAG TPA: MarR family transcriptional regulator [Clostridia bacterium]|nr:MarR family transcriptional regulator [Clostridia bacterium]
MDDKKLISEELYKCFKALADFKSHKRIQTGLRPSEIHLLIKIYKHGANTGIMTSQLSKLLNVSPPSVTPIINVLEKKKYVERLRSDDDRRIVYVRVTTKGVNFIKDIDKRFRQTLVGLVDYLGPRDSLELARLLSRAVEYFADSHGKEAVL